MEPALHELSKVLAKLDTSIANQIAEQRAAERKRNRRSWATLACAVILVITAFTNRAILTKINAVTGSGARDRSAVSQANLLQLNNDEADCRSRRQQARLPAPAKPPPVPSGIKAAELGRFLAPYSCQAQTPPEVYPGVKGEPSR